MKSILAFFRKWRERKKLKQTTSWIRKMPVVEPKPLPEPPVRKNLAWCPFAFTKFPRGRTKGIYKNLYPKGAVIHYTAGRENQSLTAAIDWQRESGMLYFVISADGGIAQNFPLTHYGYHAGKSSWKGLGNFVSKHLVGIEVVCPGKLSRKGIPYFASEPYPEKWLRRSGRKDNVEAGTYYKFTKAQEESLVKLLKWLKSNNPEVFSYDLVLGHDEVSPGRKNDPGASLSVTMPQLRRHLKNA